MICYVEDDKNIRDLVVYTLRQTGMEAEGFASGDEFRKYLAEHIPTLVLLDIMIPGDDGLAILKKMRNKKRTAQIPIIMVTAKGTEFDKIIGLDSGADDYITKPFGMMELIARVKAVLRRAPAQVEEKHILTAGNVTIDTKKHTVTVDGENVTLTFKEFQLLRYLMENKGIVMSRDRLLESIWGYDYDGGTRTVDVHIQTLRGKLNSHIIETVRGVGYKIGEDEDDK